LKSEAQTPLCNLAFQEVAAIPSPASQTLHQGQSTSSKPGKGSTYIAYAKHKSMRSDHESS
jgi:hypothetical protein